MFFCGNHDASYTGLNILYVTDFLCKQLCRQVEDNMVGECTRLFSKHEVVNSSTSSLDLSALAHLPPQLAKDTKIQILAHI